MLDFLALYRGKKISDVKLVAVSADPHIITEFADRLLGEPQDLDDPALDELEHGRMRALEIIRREKG